MQLWPSSKSISHNSNISIFSFLASLANRLPGIASHSLISLPFRWWEPLPPSLDASSSHCWSIRGLAGQVRTWTLPTPSRASLGPSDPIKSHDEAIPSCHVKSSSARSKLIESHWLIRIRWCRLTLGRTEVAQTWADLASQSSLTLIG